MTHKEQPDFEYEAPIITEEMRKGLELAAFIVRMYGDGDVWAEVILSHGEQRRALFHMAKSA